MKKRARPQAGSGVQMFPFLDAMICTMGALLVLLHAFARHGAGRSRPKRPEAQGSKPTPNLDESLEEVALAHRPSCKEARDKTQAQLADERLKLSHIEDHERRLREQFQQAANRGRRNGAARIGSELGRSTSEASKALAGHAGQSSQRARPGSSTRPGRWPASAPSAYSVVPYEGPNSTRRRPIYIECRADAVVLQPEGIELRPTTSSATWVPATRWLRRCAA